MEPSSVNLASHYGVAIDSMLPQGAGRYWKVRQVRHLAPEENQGRHHIFVQAHFHPDTTSDEVLFLVEWEDGSQEYKLRRSRRESIGHVAMFTWQVCNVQMLGAPSEVVSGLTANHPDELLEDGTRSGNTLFHHSFQVEFEEVIEKTEESIIHGLVSNGVGLTLRLLADNEILGEGTIPRSGSYRFKSIPAGDCVLQVIDPDSGDLVVESQVVELDGSNEVELDLDVPEAPAASEPAPAAPATEPPTEPPEIPAPPLDSSPQPTQVPSAEPLPPAVPPAPVASSPSELPPVPATPPVQPAAPVQPAVPLQAAGVLSVKTMEHYILFGPREHFATKVYLPLLVGELTAIGATFGFSADEAAHARRVTILASPDVVGLEVDQNLQQQGSVVLRAYGDLATIRAAIGLPA
ncbi:MAG: hypothetical protein J4G06_06915 [Caldilineaceae bacterium]|nr:hypothetical protein [Caldilineaceae bacterium]